MSKKYKLLPEGSNGLHQIKALRDFVDVKKGDVGGYIASEDNLSHDGDCWVYDTARVYGSARIAGDARVTSDARVSGDAKVYDSACVYGDARVSGNAWVSGDAKVYGGRIT